MKLIAISLVLIIISGCSSLTTTSNLYPARTTVSGAGSLFIASASDESGEKALGFGGDKFTELDFCALQARYGLSDTGAGSKPCSLTVTKIADAPPFHRRRDELQDHIIAASNQKCSGYKRLLHGLKGDYESAWGSVATVLAGTSAVVTHVKSAQAFAAGSVAASGIRSELDNAYFASKTVEVITAGINSRRAEILTEINEARKQSSSQTVTYTLNRAVADALRYHSACSAITGMEVAIESIARAKNPGPKEVLKFYQDLGAEKSNLNITIEPE